MKKNIIVAGQKGAGKSTSLLKLAARLKACGVSVGGVISRHILKDGRRCGYEAVNPATGQVLVLSERPANGEDPPHHHDDESHVIVENEKDSTFNYCHYVFYKKTFAEGNRWIKEGLEKDVLFVDEVGLIEMTHHKGWDYELPLAAVKNEAAGKKPLLIYGLRDDFAEKFSTQWDFFHWDIFLVKSGGDLDAAADQLLSLVQGALQ